MEGKDTIREMVKIANGRLQIMAGGGVTASNIRELVQYTGVKEVHGSGSLRCLNVKTSSRLCVQCHEI